MQNDRKYWLNLLDKIASPVLSRLCDGNLKKEMNVDYSPTWDASRDKESAYMEAFGRLISGVAPFIDLEDLNLEEKFIQKKIKDQSLKCLENCITPGNPDYFYWDTKSKQILVDSAYMAQAFLVAPKTLWEPLSKDIKIRYINNFKKISNIIPVKNNWVLFSGMLETFLMFVGEQFQENKIKRSIFQIKKWYVGDGWYSDGDLFCFDHYNGYVIHPMLVDILKINSKINKEYDKDYELAYKRMQRYGIIQERLISPEGTFPIIGRSSTYRMGAFQPLVKLALDEKIPEKISPAQVRSALTCVFKNIFIEKSFREDGFLNLGLVGDKQSDLSDYYTNTGSLYITCLAFLPLGLKSSSNFWSDSFEPWTQLKAWSGEKISRDYCVDY